jgi:hypothetical protein
MFKHLTLLCGALLSVTLTGCVGSGPNTEQGAVTGGAIGALAGAIIGHNSRGGDALGGAILGGVGGAIAGGVIGNSVDQERGTVYQPGGTVYDRPGQRRVSRNEPPQTPAPLADTYTPSPAPNAVWIPGYWSYDGRGYGWQAGHWEIPPPMAKTYVTAHWEQRPNGYAFVPSYWQ